MPQEVVKHLFTTTLSSSIIGGLFFETTGADRVNVFIVDDTFYSRGRSKKVELRNWGVGAVCQS
ncbi:MAG: hypothetical protein LBS35_02810 [Synergistaceae bacterium]|nr:hypothetical protein [Synergistaceae bacterium]